MPKLKEKREEVLYAKITKTNKKFVRSQYRKKGYSTLSEYIDELINELRKKK